MTLNYNELLNRYNGSKISVVSNSDHSWKRLRNDMADEIGILNGKLFVNQKIEEHIITDANVTLYTGFTNIDLAFITKPTDYKYYGTSTTTIGSSILEAKIEKTSEITDSTDCIGYWSDKNQPNYYSVAYAKGTTLAEMQADLTDTIIYYQLATPISYDESDFAELGITVSGSLKSHNDYTQYSVENYNLLPFSEINYPTNIAQSLKNVSDKLVETSRLLIEPQSQYAVTSGFESGWSGSVNYSITLDKQVICSFDLTSTVDITVADDILLLNILLPTYSKRLLVNMFTSGDVSIAGSFANVSVDTNGTLSITPVTSTVTTNARKIKGTLIWNMEV